MGSGVPAISPVGRLLEELIALPSVNPAFLPAGDPRTGEAGIGEHLAREGRRRGLEPEWMPVAPGRSNLLFRVSPSGPVKGRVLLAPHLDTIGEPNLDALLRPHRVGGRIVGRGACDTKGCVAAMLMALFRVAESGRRPESTEIVFAGLVDEENEQLGSRRYAAEGPRAELAIVGEPTRLEVVTAHKGDVWLRLKALGRAAHGSTPHLGVNAGLEAARMVEALLTRYAATLARRRHPLLGRPTINVGAIHGGTQPNVVPEECVILLDRRTLPGETGAGVQREIERFLRSEKLRPVFENLRAAECLPLETDPTLPLVRQFLRAVGRRTTRGVNYFCDAAHLSAGGIPSVVYGPGDIAHAHTRSEWIGVAGLERAARVLEVFLRRLD